MFEFVCVVVVFVLFCFFLCGGGGVCWGGGVGAWGLKAFLLVNPHFNTLILLKKMFISKGCF